MAQKLIGSHLADGEMSAGSEIGLRIDQTLAQDATGTMVMLELEALGLTDALGSGAELTVHAGDQEFTIRHRLSPRQVAMVLADGQIPLVRSRQAT